MHAIDIDRRAVANTLANAGRNGVADRMTGEAIDLYPWVPKTRYDVVVASLYQMPVDPYDEPNTHRPLDFWGRNLLDHLITLLPKLLEDDGVAYIMQLSILSQTRTADMLAEHGFASRVVDFAFFDFHELFQQRSRQIERVEELSDAYHLRFKDEDVMVAYLLEVGRTQPLLGGHRAALGFEPCAPPSRRPSTPWRSPTARSRTSPGRVRCSSARRPSACAARTSTSWPARSWSPTCTARSSRACRATRSRG